MKAMQAPPRNRLLPSKGSCFFDGDTAKTNRFLRIAPATHMISRFKKNVLGFRLRVRHHG